MAEYYQTLTLKKQKSGDTVLKKEISFSAHTASPIAFVELHTKYEDCNLDSDGNGITITDAANWTFEIDKQIIDWTPRTYYFEITITTVAGDVRTYMNGNWEIVE
jgi:hypothetical protein